jgi:hypothetical protein
MSIREVVLRSLQLHENGIESSNHVEANRRRTDDAADVTGFRFMSCAAGIHETNQLISFFAICDSVRPVIWKDVIRFPSRVFKNLEIVIHLRI